jgi:myo-inositol 2-dehydrogenase/D-chiro-inositol 1-dehydrogenase
MGRFHAETLANYAGASLAAVIDANLETAERVAEAGGCSRFGDDPIPVLADPNIEAVVIATPALTHADLIRRAAVAGKAIFCEKPLAVSLGEAQAAADAVNEAEVPFQIGFQRRFDPGVERLRRLAASGELGTLETFRSVTADPSGPSYEELRQAAGIFHDTLSHDMDMALLFFGAIREVYAWGDACLDPRLLEIGKPDTTTLMLRFESGRLGLIENRLRTGYGYETLLEVGGSLGKGVVRDDRADSLTLYRGDGIVRPHVHWFLERFDLAYRRELHSFIDDVLAGRTPAPGVEQGLEVQRACLAAERSFLEGRLVGVDELRVDPSGEPGRELR